MADLHDIVEGVQDAVSKLTPTPIILQEESTAYDLKTRLEWGEPALSIIDIRDREAFNQVRITGAVSMPMAQLDQMKSTLQPRTVPAYRGCPLSRALGRTAGIDAHQLFERRQSG
jgi:Rhodanese-like domain